MQLLTAAVFLSVLLLTDTQLPKQPASQQLWNHMENNREPKTITNSGGNPVDDKTNVMTVGERGPMLLQDMVFIDETQHFNRERIPERVVHAKGAGAFGYFEVTNDIKPYSKATLFDEIGKKTPVLIRFSTVIGERGTADTLRDPRGFAIKFYTDDGIWDLVGNNTPIFFTRDPFMFFSFIHSQKRNPVTNLRDLDAYWDFLTLRPESIHQVMIQFTDRGTPDGFRHMDGYGSNTYKLVNALGQAVYCKFHVKTNQGIKNLSADVADRLAGEDPEYATRDLYNAIASGNFPSWTFYIQVMTFEEAERFRWNPFDVTLIWPEEEYPLIEVGRIVLDRNPTNYFADIEQAAFAPNNMIPGVEPSPDKMLQGRLFAYMDTQFHRLGPNHKQIPVNSPFRSKIVNTQRDGLATYSDNQGGAPNYFPSSFDNRIHCPDAKFSAFSLSGDIARFNSSDDDNYSQPGIMWRTKLSEQERVTLVTNLANSIRQTSQFIQERAVKNFYMVDPRFGQMLSEAL